nr:S24 family peptidase [Ezakiella coagulans]
MIFLDAYKNIRNRRKELKMSQEDLAIKTGYNDRSMIAKIEAGLVDLSISKIKVFADVLKVPVSELVGWEETSPPILTLPAQQYPLWPFTTGAGIADYEFSSESLEKISIPDQFLGKYAGRKDIVIFEVNGESMNKIIPNRSYVAVEYKNIDYCPQTGDVVVFRILGDGLGIKRYIDMYDEIMLKPESTDPVYTELRFNKNSADDLEILGKVVMYNVLLN